MNEPMIYWQVVGTLLATLVNSEVNIGTAKLHPSELKLDKKYREPLMKAMSADKAKINEKRTAFEFTGCQ